MSLKKEQSAVSYSITQLKYIVYLLTNTVNGIYYDFIQSTNKINELPNLRKKVNSRMETDTIYNFLAIFSEGSGG